LTDKKYYYIHPSSIVDTDKIGKNTKIWAFVHILNDVTIGKNCNICDYCFLESKVKIGNNVTIKNGVSLWEGIEIGDNVFIGPNASFTNDKKPRSKVHPEKYLITKIKKGAAVGANATILPGITIGCFSMVGAGSVVTKNVEDFTMVVGNPAVFKSFICKCAESFRLNNNNLYTCSCGESYKLESGKIINIK